MTESITTDIKVRVSEHAMGIVQDAKALNLMTDAQVYNLGMEYAAAIMARQAIAENTD